MTATIYWKFLFSSRLAVTRTLLLSLTLVLSIALAASQTLPCDTSQESNPKTLDNTSKMAGNRERTFIMLKPDAVQRGLVGEIIKRFEQKGFKLVAMKMMHVSSTKLYDFGKGILTCSWHEKSKLRILSCNVFLGGGNFDCNQKNAVALRHFKFVKTGSTNPQYDKRLFIELQVQFMKIANSEHSQNMLCK